MHIFSILGRFLLVSAAMFQDTQHCVSQLIVNIEVSGKYVVKTGIRTYTFSAYSEDFNVIIACSAPVSLPANISLLTSDRSIIKRQVTSGNDSITFVEKSMQPIQRKYLCVLEASTWITNNSYAEFVVTSEVNLRRVQNSVLCASSIGHSGYDGEITILRCMSVYRSYKCSLQGSSNIVQREVLKEPLSEKFCNCNLRSRRRSCTLRSISVAQSVVLNIFTTVNVNQSETSLSVFICTSDPPRLLYWKVLGHYGDLLDFDNLDQSVNVDTTVNITQSPGETSLRILEAVAGGNYIHTVMCSTYDTEARVVASLHIPPESETNSHFDVSSVKPTEKLVTSYDTTPSEGSTVELSTTKLEKHSQECGVDLTERNEIKADFSFDYFLMVVVGLPLLVTNLTLIVIVLYMHRKNRRKMGVNTEVSSQGTSPETVLHDNPAYLAFNELKDHVPANESEETECTYSNL